MGRLQVTWYLSINFVHQISKEVCHDVGVGIRLSQRGPQPAVRVESRDQRYYWLNLLVRYRSRSVMRHPMRLTNRVWYSQD